MDTRELLVAILVVCLFLIIGVYYLGRETGRRQVLAAAKKGGQAAAQSRSSPQSSAP